MKSTSDAPLLMSLNRPVHRTLEVRIFYILENCRQPQQAFYLPCLENSLTAVISPRLKFLKGLLSDLPEELSSAHCSQ